MSLRSLRPLALGLLLAFAGSTGALAALGTLTGVSAAPNPASPGANVAATLSKTGADCGFKIKYGDGGPNAGPFGFTSANKVMSHVYAQPGSYTIEVWGKVKGSKPACKGGTKTTQVSVTGGGGRGGSPTLLKSPAGPLKPPAGLKLYPSPPPSPKFIPPELVGIPRIDSVLFVAGPIGNVEGAVLAPGGRLYLKGAHFGTEKGSIYLKPQGGYFPDFPSGKMPLEDLKWVGTDKINGRIPSGLKGPLNLTNVAVRVRRSNGKTSSGFPRTFQVPVEYRTVKWTEVVVLVCGTAGDTNRCNGSLGWNGYDPSMTISAMHNNGLFHLETHSDKDRYRIQLHDGWVFSHRTWKKSALDPDGDYVHPPAPQLPVGGTVWETKIKWAVTPSDAIRYWLKVHVKRAKGAW